MKTQVAAFVFALSGASAFAPTSSMKASTALNSQQDDSWISQPWSGVKQEDFINAAEDYETDSWHYQPWSSVKQEDHYPLNSALPEPQMAAPPAPEPEVAAPAAMPEMQQAAPAAVTV
jgi:hypothetical protein